MASSYTTDEQGKNVATPLLSESDQAIFDRVSGAWITFLFGAFFLAIGGVFTDNAVLALSLTVVIGVLVALRKLRPSREFGAVGIAILIFVFLISFPSSPSVFSGRDQGSYSEAAVRLAHDHSLQSHIPAVEQDFFRLYGEGKALNVPGFFFTSDGSLVTQFPLGNIAWFGASVSLFGVVGLSLANAFTLFVSLLTLFVFLRRFLTLPFAISGVAIAALSFPFVWIQEQTLSENLALPLFLMLSVHLVSFLTKPDRKTWWLIVLSGTFLCLTRIEGFFLLTLSLAIIFSQKESRQYVLSHFFTTLLSAIVVVSTTLGIDIVSNSPFYRTIGKAVREAFMASGSNTLSPALLPSSIPILRTLGIFWTYGMISILSLAFLGVILLLKGRQFIRLVPALLAFPTLVYFFSPQISPDHPWMLRRFVFAFWPAAIVLAVFALARLQASFEERYPGKILFRPILFSSFFSALLIIPALPATAPRLFFSENKYLLSDIEMLSGYFSERDLVLVDRLSSGDPFSIIADPMSTLFGKNAIYFFNPNDLLRLDIAQFEHVYLIVRDGDENAYQSALNSHFELRRVRPYALRTSTFSRETDPSRLPLRNDDIVSGTIFLVVPK